LAGPSLVLDSERALQCLISGAISQDELPSLIEMVFSDEKATNMVSSLQGSGVQTLIDGIDEVCYILLSRGMGCLILILTLHILIGLGEL